MSSRLQVRGITTAAMLALAVGGGLAMAQAPSAEPGRSTSPAASCSGFSTQVSGIVQQFGFAMMLPVARSPLTSGTTSG